MNLHDFEYFNALGDLLSFTAVSNHFGVSQPTITYAVKRLEQYYNCNLIYKDPSHRTVVLTDEDLDETALAGVIADAGYEMTGIHKEAYTKKGLLSFLKK